MQTGLSTKELPENPASKPVANERWEAFLAANPRGQFQQSWRWAEVKVAEGWQGVLETWPAGAENLAGGFLMLIKLTRLGRVGFVNKGPVLREETVAELAKALAAIQRVAREQHLRAVILQLPDGSQIAPELLWQQGVGKSPVPGILDATLVADVAGGPVAVEARMSRKAKQHSRFAQKSGVKVVECGREGLPIFFELMLGSCRRQGVSPNPGRLDLLERLWDVWFPEVRLLLARYQSQWVAGLLLLRFNRRCTFWKKGWNEACPELHANAFLNHHAMLMAAEWQCDEVDFVGMDRSLALRWRENKPMEEVLAKSRYAFNLRLGARPRILPQAHLYLPSHAWRWVADRLLGCPKLGRWLMRRMGG